MPLHIGMVGVSPVGASLANRQLFRYAREILRPGEHPIVTIHNIPFAAYIDAVRNDDWVKVGSLLRTSAEILADAGAQLVFTPDNMVQHALPLVETSCSVPWVNMAEIVAREIEKDQRTVVGIIGTTIVTNGSTYQAVLGMRGIGIHAPKESETSIIEQIIFEELAYGSLTHQSLQTLQSITRSLRDRGCDALLFGCSEAPELVDRGDWPLPVYDACSIVTRETLLRACKT